MNHSYVLIAFILLIMLGMTRPCSAESISDDLVLADIIFSAPLGGATTINDPILLAEVDNWDSQLLLHHEQSTSKSVSQGITAQMVDVLVKTFVIADKNHLVRQSKTGWLLELTIPGLGGMTDAQILSVARAQILETIGPVQDTDLLQPQGMVGSAKVYRAPASLPSALGAKGGMVVLASGDRLGLFLAKAHPAGVTQSGGCNLSIAANSAWFSGYSGPGKLVAP